MPIVATSLPTGQRGQILAVALVVLVIASAWFGVISPLVGLYDARSDATEALRSRAAREAALIQALPALKAEAAAVSRTPARAVLAGASDAIAGATLQEQVQSMASSANAQLTSIETLPAEQVGAYRRIGVHVELSAQLNVIIQLLRAIEEAQPSMLVDDIRLTATPVGPQNTQLPLDAAFTVYAFRVGAAKDDQP
jgi:general secretion pathway protein M